MWLIIEFFYAAPCHTACDILRHVKKILISSPSSSSSYTYFTPHHQAYVARQRISWRFTRNPIGAFSNKFQAENRFCTDDLKKYARHTRKNQSTDMLWLTSRCGDARTVKWYFKEVIFDSSTQFINNLRFIVICALIIAGRPPHFLCGKTYAAKKDRSMFST